MKPLNKESAQKLFESGIGTETQKRYLKSFIETGSYRETARQSNTNESTVRRSITGLRKRAATMGLSPENDWPFQVADGHYAHGVSDYHQWKDEQGNTRQQWVKSRIDKQKLEDICRTYAETILNSFDPLPPISPPEVKQVGDLLTFLPIADLHLGQLSDTDETGDHSWDLKKAKAAITETTQRIINKADNTQEALIVNFGDSHHVDNNSKQTPKNKNTLDVDGRFFKIAEATVYVFEQIIELALFKFPRVKFINLFGNHDPISGLYLGIALEKAFKNNSRVEFINDGCPFKFHIFGNNCMGFTHGDDIKPQNLGGPMMLHVGEEAGRCNHRYWFTGHIHKQKSEDLDYYFWESIRTITPLSSFASKIGCFPIHRYKAIQFHKQDGRDTTYEIPCHYPRG